MKELPKKGYTDFNKFTYELLKPYLTTHNSYHNYKSLVEQNKIYISWEINPNKKEWNSYYLCNNSGRDYYEWQELTKIQKIYELW